MDTASSSSPSSISPHELAGILAAPGAPLLLDVRRTETFRDADRIVTRARRCAPREVEQLARESQPCDVVVYCVHGLEIGQRAAQQLRDAGWNARWLAGGIEGLIEAGLPTIRKRADLGVTGERPSRWITRARPKIDRIACPWLIRRFIDPQAQFFYVPVEEVFAKAKELEAVPYDLPGAPIGHVGDHCSFDALLAAFDLHDPALDALALIVRGADTGRPDLAPQCAGLLAVSQGMSALHADDHAMLEATMPVYDALYAWCRKAGA